MEEEFVMISIEDDEQCGIIYEENTESLSEIDTHWCLVGRFLTDSSIDFQVMQHKMASLWRPGKGMYVNQLEANQFLFQFYHEIDIKRGVLPSSSFDSIGRASQKEDETKKNDKFCEKLFDTPMEMIEKPYGSWMRAEPRRRSHTMGSKWLRSGGTIPSNNARDDRGAKAGTVKDAAEISQSGSPLLMSTVSWNCQGMGPPWKLRFLQDVIRQERPSIVFLCETLSNKEKMEWVQARLGFKGMIVVEAQGRSGGLALLWKETNQVKLISLLKHHIDVEVNINGMQTWRLTGFYGEPKRSKRRKTWDLLRNLARDSNLPWCTIGDMNNIVSQEDKKGGTLYPQRLLDGFNEVLENTGLKDLELYGHQYIF
ncbi:hypothetical protein POM88_041779 [Heracleum sosnowskyi]|uniref:Endonuclease/exonuclease/phosphatase domain-containing protein n=1 Tax=Heracleum sosnowskyi TaxID=360622 RepID=A0AAD8HGK6_9APIA|nr:hypothetical protein POM88_041779 [Heracleum sosnowskyi]